jgi:hypothetical protein
MFIHHIQTAALRVIREHAQPTPSLLRRRIFALYHHQLLSAARVARQPEESRPLSQSAGVGPPALPFRNRWLRGHARARVPSADW